MMRPLLTPTNRQTWGVSIYTLWVLTN